MAHTLAPPTIGADALLQSDSRVRQAYSERQLRAMVWRLAKCIHRDLAGKRVLLVSVRTGALFFTTDLARALGKLMPIELVTILASSYPAGSDHPAGELLIDLAELPEDLSDYHVVVVDDVADTCGTLKQILERILERRPAGLSVAVAFNKPESGKPDVRARVNPFLRYIGFDHIPVEEFLIGYGMDADLDAGPGRLARALYREARNVYVKIRAAVPAQRN